MGFLRQYRGVITYMVKTKVETGHKHLLQQEADKLQLLEEVVYSTQQEVYLQE